MSGPSRLPNRDAELTARGARRRLGWVAAGCVLGLLLATGAAWSRRDDSWTRVRDAGVVRIGYALEAPYAFVTARGRVTGEAPEIARRVAARLGLAEPEWILTDFGRLIPELESGRFDVIAAGLFITEERARVVAFSRPTTRVGPGLLVPRGNPRDLGAYAEAAARPDVRLAALADSVEARALAGAGLPPERLLIVPDTVSGLSLLRAGRVDGLALSSPTVRWMARQPDTGEWAEAIEVASDDAGARVAFAFRRSDRRLRKKWDDALAGFLGGPEHARLAEEFGFGSGVGAGGRP